MQNSQYQIPFDNLFKAAAEGNTEVVKNSSSITYVNLCNENNLTPLWIAARNGHTDTVVALVERCGAHRNTADPKKRSAVYIAAQNGHTETVRALVKLGANCTEPDEDGFSPLQAAAEYGHRATVLVLLPYSNNDIKVYSLKMAAFYGHTKTVLAIVKKGDLEPDILHNGLSSAVWFAARNGYTKTVLALVRQCGAKCTEPSKGSFTPLYIAAKHGHKATVLALLRECKVDPLKTVEEALELDDIGVLTFLEEKGGVDPEIGFEVAEKRWEKINTHNEKIINEPYECPVCMTENDENIGFRSCGHRVCESCWKVLETKDVKRCPLCRKDIEYGVPQKSVQGQFNLYSCFFVDIPELRGFV